MDDDYGSIMRAQRLYRRQAIKTRCPDCSGFVKKEIRKPLFDDCPLYSYRIGTGYQEPKAKDKAVREYRCEMGMAGQISEVSSFHSVSSPLHPYRTLPANKLDMFCGMKEKIPVEVGRVGP